MILVIGFLLLFWCIASGVAAQRKRREEAFQYEPAQLLGVARFATDEECKKSGLFSSRGIPCGHSPDKATELRYDQDPMAITVAPVGSGKSTCQLDPALLSMDDRSIILVSSKADSIAVAAQHRAKVGDCSIMAPYGGIVSGIDGIRNAHINALDILSDPREPKANFYQNSRSIAQGNIFLETENSQSEFFSASALNITQGVAMGTALHEPPQKRTLSRVAEIMATDEAYEWASEISAITHSELLRQKLGPLATARKDDRTIEGILQTARKDLDWHHDPAIVECMAKSDVDIPSFRERVQTLCITVPTHMISARLNGYMINVILNRLLLPGRGKRKVTVIIDDFTTYGALPCVENAVAICRAYNVQLWLLLQDLSQLEARYPRSWQTFLSNAGLRVFMTPQDEKTATYVSSQLGIAQVSGWQKSVNFGSRGDVGEGWSKPPMSRPLEHPDQVRACPDSHMYVFVRGMANTIKARRIPYFKQWKFRRKAQPDPFYQPKGFWEKVWR